MLEHVLEHGNIKTITLEHGGVGKNFEDRSDKDVLKRKLIRSREILNN